MQIKFEFVSLRQSLVGLPFLKIFSKKYRNSIQNQKMYLEEYARQHGMRNIRHFSDDGYSGTNFNRPGFNALLEEIEAGHVAVLIVKESLPI